MKSHFSRVVALFLVASTSFQVQAQTTSPVPVFKAKAPLPRAQELLDHLFDPYAAAQTFSGTFDILIKGNDPANKVSEIHLKTRHSFDERGDLTRQDAILRFVGREEPKQEQTLHFVDDGHHMAVVAIEQKVWWPTSQHDASSALATVLKPLLDGVVQVLNRTPNFVPSVSRGVDAGRPVFVLTAKHTDVLHIVVDAQTRALRSFELSDNVNGGVSIHGSEQRFNEPIRDAEFAWTAPPDFKQVAEGDVTFPPSLGITIPGSPNAGVLPH